MNICCNNVTDRIRQTLQVLSKGDLPRWRIYIMNPRVAIHQLKIIIKVPFTPTSKSYSLFVQIYD